MLRDILRRYADLGWKTAADNTVQQNSTIQQPKPPTGNFQTVQPTKPPVVNRPQRGFTDEDLRMEQEAEELERQGNNPQQYGQMLNDDAELERGAAIFQWVRSNLATQNPIPQEWASDPSLLERVKTVAESLAQQTRSQIVNPHLLATVQSNDPQSAMSPDERAIYDARAKAARPLIETMSTKHKALLNQLANRVQFQTNSPEARNEFITKVLMDNFGPRESSHLQDNRLSLLMDPESVEGLMKYPPFAQRYTAFLQQAAEEGQPAPTPQDIVNLRNDPQSKKEAMGFLDHLLDPSSPGKKDSIVDALTFYAQQDALPPWLMRRMGGASKFFGQDVNREQAKRNQMEGTHLNKQVGDEGSPQMVDMMGGDPNRDRDVVRFSDPEKEAIYTALRKQFHNKMNPIKDLSRKVMADFYDYYNDGRDPPHMTAKSFGGAPVSVPDVFQAIMAAGIMNIKELLSPGNQKQKEQQLSEIQKNNSDELKTRYSTRGGEINVSKGENGLDFSLKGLVKAPAVKPLLNQLGYIKERIHRLYQEGIQDPTAISQKVMAESKQILAQIQQDYQQNPQAFSMPPANVIGCDISPGFVKNTLREPLATAQVLKSSIAPGNKVASEAVNYMEHQWTKLYPFIFKTVEQFPPEVRASWRELVGIHKRMADPIGNEDIDKLEQLPPDAFEGKKWWEASLDKIGDKMFPDTASAGFDQYHAMQKELKRVRDMAAKGKIPAGMTPEMMEQQVQSKYPEAATVTPEQIEQFKQRASWEKRFNGMTSVDNVRQIYEKFFNGEPPEHVKKYLMWREKTKKGRAGKWAELLLQRIVTAYFHHEARLEKLAAVKSSLSKVGATPQLDALISRASLEAFEDLQRLVELL